MVQKLGLSLILVSIAFTAPITLYCDYGWGYWYYIFNWIGPNVSEGVTAAGFSGSIEYRGYIQFTLPGYPGPGTEINSLTLRLCNNTGGSGLTIDINRVTSENPTAYECGVQPPIYLTDQPVNPNAEEYTFFTLPDAAKNDFLNAWQGGAPWFGFGFAGEGYVHFFYACWFDPYLDAALIIDYTIGIEEEISETILGEPEFSIYPNPFTNHLVIKSEIPIRHDAWRTKSETSLEIYDAAGRLVKDFSRLTFNVERSTILWDGTDDSGRRLPAGVYFVKLDCPKKRVIQKVIKME